VYEAGFGQVRNAIGVPSQRHRRILVWEQCRESGTTIMDIRLLGADLLDCYDFAY